MSQASVWSVGSKIYVLWQTSCSANVLNCSRTGCFPAVALIRPQKDGRKINVWRGPVFLNSPTSERSVWFTRSTPTPDQALELTPARWLLNVLQFLSLGKGIETSEGDPIIYQLLGEELQLNRLALKCISIAAEQRNVQTLIQRL